MDVEKREGIYEALQGITYLEWEKLSFSIEAAFKAEASNQANKLLIAGPEKLMEFYKHSF